MKLNELKPSKGSRKNRNRVGRGNASSGTYSGRGMKGQSARTGGKRRPGFEGGQTPLYMRMPKLGGFKNPRRIEYTVVNVSELNDAFKDGDTVDAKTLVKKMVIKDEKNPIKILGNGELKIALTVKVAKVSKNAEEKITQAKGKVEAASAPEKKAEKKAEPKKKEVAEEEKMEEKPE